jgi:apurinic endonuclease APN1
MTFASSPRSLQKREFTIEEIENYLAKKRESNIGSHFFHAPYLVKLVGKSDYVAASIDLLNFYQDIAEKISGAGTIFHIGDSNLQNVPAIQQIVTSHPKVKLILEGPANGSLEDLAKLIANCKLPTANLGVCLDTQHTFASGEKLETILDKFDQLIGLKYLSVIHLNDSKTDFGSKVDRHENLGQGKIGESILKSFIKDPRIQHVPLILEVPGAGDGPRKEDIDKLKELVY